MVGVGDKVVVAPMEGEGENLVVVGAGGGGGILEGDYNTWTMKWLWAPDDGFRTYYMQTFHMDETNDLFYLSWEDDKAWPESHRTRYGAYHISDHSTIFESPRDIDYMPDPYVGAGDYSFYRGVCRLESGCISTSNQTYMLLCRSNEEIMEVWRAGVKLWSRSATEDTGVLWETPYIAAISLTGKHIMAYIAGSAKLILYEGSKV